MNVNYNILATSIFNAIHSSIADEAISKTFDNVLKQHLYSVDMHNFINGLVQLNLYDALHKTCTQLITLHNIFSHFNNLLNNLPASTNLDTQNKRFVSNKVITNHEHESRSRSTKTSKIDNCVNKTSLAYPLTKVKKEMVKKLLDRDGVYRYEAGISHRGLYLYHVLPMSQCVKTHVGAPCLPSGWYPHLTRDKWQRYVNNNNSVQLPIKTGSRANPLRNELHLLQSRFQRCKQAVSQSHREIYKGSTAPLDNNISDVETGKDASCTTENCIELSVDEIEVIESTDSQNLPPDFFNNSTTIEEESQVFKPVKKRSKRKAKSSATSDSTPLSTESDAHADELLLAFTKASNKLQTAIRWDTYLRYMYEKDYKIPKHIIADYLLRKPPSDKPSREK